MPGESYVPLTSDTEGAETIEVSNLWKLREFEPAVTVEMMKFYASEATGRKEKIDELAAEVNQRQDKMRLVNDMISEINNLTDEKNGLDISQNAAILEKLQVLKELGVKIKDNQLKFDAIERDRLIENLHLAGDSWDKENRYQTQQMERLVKNLDCLIMMLKDIDKKEGQAKQPILSAMRPGH